MDILQTLVDQTRKALDANLYYLSLIGALTIPDIAGALGSDGGKATGKLYAGWYEDWVRPRLLESRGRINPLSGTDCYAFRCSLLHQGRSLKYNSPKKMHIMFIEPPYPNYQIHYCMVRNEAMQIQLDAFVEEVLTGCELWLNFVKETDPFEKNYQKFARRHANGYAPIFGVPVVA